MFIKDTPGRTAIHNEDFCSIGIISYNRHDLLHNLIDSIHEHANMPFEIVVHDDGGILYDDFNFIKSLRPKISRIAINTGVNTGLHVGANNAAAMTRSKYVVLINDDIKILKPFMRQAVDVLQHAPYVAGICLSSSGSPATEFTKHTIGVISCITPNKTPYQLFFADGGSWAVAFRKEYWLEVGGYSEDSTYGDGPFLSKGQALGYFSCMLGLGSAIAVDTDKHPGPVNTPRSTGKFSGNKFCNYPKIFPWSDADHVAKSAARQTEVGTRQNRLLGSETRSEFTTDWGLFMRAISDANGINWGLLEASPHSRFLDQIKKDLLK